MGEVSPQDLTDRVEAAYAAVAAAEAELLSALGDFDGTEVWKLDAMRGVSDWLAYRFALSGRSASRYAKGSRAVAQHPVVAAALSAGELSLDQALPVCQVLDNRRSSLEDEAQAVEEAVAMSVPALERAARLSKPVPDSKACERHNKRTWRMRQDKEAGMFHFWASLPDTEGATVREELRRRASQMGKNPDGTWDPIDARMADALYELCAKEVAQDPDPDRATIVVFKDGDVPDVRFGPAIAESTYERLLCDARLQHIAEGNGVEDVSATAPRWMRRLVEKREGGCVWPGCHRADTLLHCHHIVHRSKGGLTALWNLVLLCHRHHRAVHEEGFGIGRTGESLRFSRPDGTPLRERSPTSWSEALEILKKLRDELEDP